MNWINKIILFCLFLAVMAVNASGQTVMPLYQNIPNAISGKDNEQRIDRSWGYMLKNVSIPQLYYFPAAKDKANGTALLICPGGGYAGLAFEREGTDVAKAFNEMGIAAFVLKYRLPSDETMLDKTIGPLQDAQQAIKTIRENAIKWNIKADRIGVIGFSAGGHLASTAGTHFNKAEIPNAENTSLRPDFMILMYPVISFADSLTHAGSKENLIGKNPTKEKEILYSNELQVKPTTPPAFIVHAGDDKTVKVENSLRFYEALHQKNVAQAALLIYPKGGHGFGLNNSTTTDKWLDHCKAWLQSNGWLSKE